MLEIFGGIGLRVLRATLAAGYVIRYCIYVECVGINRSQLLGAAAVQAHPTPKESSSVRAILGLFSRYKKFVQHSGSIAFPLNRLVRYFLIFSYHLLLLTLYA